MAHGVLFVLGLVTGSLLNIGSDRITRNDSPNLGPFRCDSCGHPLAWRDVIPLISFLWLRGRCGYCHALIPRRAPVVELATGLLFAGIGAVTGWQLQTVPALLYGSLLLVITVVDVERQIIPNQLVYPALPLVWLTSVLHPAANASGSIVYLLPSSFLGGHAGTVLLLSLAGGLVAFLIMLISWLAYPSGMGAGDVKLAALVGLMAGFPLTFLVLIVSLLAGGLAGAILLLSGKRGRKDPIPFGPFLALGGLVAIMWGDSLASWYWHY